MEAEKDASATLRLRTPVGVTLGLAVLLALGIAGLGEVLARTDLARRGLPTQSVGIGHPQLDLKLVLLDDMVRQEGAPDCLFVGSSQVHRGIDPDVFAEAFRSETGRRIRSFNFGLGGLSETGEEPMAKILMTRYRPALMVVGTSSYGLEDEKALDLAARLTTNPWMRYHQGEFSFDGWLVEHSSAFREYLGCLFWAEPRLPAKQAGVRRAAANITEKGYGYLEAGEFRKLGPVNAEILRSFTGSPARLDLLSRVLRLRGGGERLVVEMPVHESVVHLFQGGKADHEQGLSAIARAAAEQGVTFWRYRADRPIPQDGWSDFIHMNQIGAKIYSRWLGRKLGEAVRQGLVKPPAA